MIDDKLTKWRVFKEIIKTRTKEPFQHPEYLFYFFLINLIFCALGIYVSIINNFYSTEAFDFRSLNTNLGTFYISILATGCFDLFLSRAKLLKTTMSMFSVLILILGIGALIISSISRLRYALPITLIFCFISLFIWWIANADNEKLMSDEVSMGELTGGNLKQKILGDLTGFKTK